MARSKQEIEKYRRRYLPEQIDATRRKLKALANEARRMGMEHLLLEGE